MRHFGQPQQQGLGDDVAFADAALRLTQRLALLLAKALLASLLPTGTTFTGTLIGEVASRTQIPLAPGAQRTMTFIESLLTLVQTVLAGFMSMQFLMGSAMRHLLTPDPRPDRGGEVPWQVLSNLYSTRDPNFQSSLLCALAEARRVDPPVTIVQRYAGPNGGAIGGVLLPKDCAVFAVVASAHRDTSFGPDPDQYHWDRAALGQLSLGRGTHECVGRALQDLVVPAAMTRLLDAMPELKLCDTQAVPAWLDNLYFRSLQALPVHRCT
jgi:cytochrome P450